VRGEGSGLAASGAPLPADGVRARAAGRCLDRLLAGLDRGADRDETRMSQTAGGAPYGRPGSLGVGPRSHCRTSTKLVEWRFGRPIMNVPSKVLAWLVLAIVFLPSSLLPPLAMAQGAPQPLSPEQIDQLVAPIALHPDKLLAQILMASTYLLEVVQAARFVKENPKVQGDQLNEALKRYTWDDSVKSLVFFPQVLTMLNDKLDWLQKLGDAFLAQQNDVMAGIQRLRARAQSAGQLKSTPEQQVIVEPAVAAAPPPPAAAPPAAPPQTNVVVQTPPPQTNVQVVQSPPTVIRIEPTNPEVVYVPSYNPTAVYGEWPPAYPPYSPYPAGYFAAGLFTFAAGAEVGAALWGNCNWRGGD